MSVETTTMLCDEEAERAVLCGQMLDPHVIDGDPLQEMDFSSHQNQLVYRVQRDLIARNVPCDYLTLLSELKAQGLLERAGGNSYIAEIANTIPSVAAVPHFVDILRDLTLKRNLEQLGKAINQQLREQNSTDDILRTIDQAIQTTQPASNWIHLHDAIQPTIDGIDAACAGDSGQGLSMGLVDLDQKINGLRPGNLVIVAGRPGMGKTSLGVGACLEVGKNAVVGLFTLEMSTTEMVKRMLAMEGKNLSIGRLDKGELSGDGWTSLATTAGHIGERNIYLCDDGHLTADSLRRKALVLKRAHGLDLLVVDYLQLMTTDKRAESRVAGMTDISRALKLLAKELDIPVVALSQLNRQCEGRPDKRPMLSDLRETGAIEQDADVVMFIYRDEVYHEESPDRGIAEILIRKNRHGPTGEVRVSWIGERTAFKDLPMQPSNLQSQGRNNNNDGL